MSNQTVTRAAAASRSTVVPAQRAKRPVSDMEKLWLEMGVGGSAVRQQAAQIPIPSSKWAWRPVADCPLHDDDLHAMVRHVTERATFLFTGGKDGCVMATTVDEASQGVPGSEVVAARGMVNQYGLTVAAWVTAMAVNPSEAIVAVGYRDGLIQCFDISDPLQWVAKKGISVAARRNDNQKGNNEGRIHHLSYVSPIETEGNKPVLAVGVSGALVRVSQSGKETTLGFRDGVWINDVVELSARDMCLLEGEIVSQYRWGGKREGWKKLVAVRLGDPADNSSTGFKSDWKKEPFWEEVKKAQAYGTSMLHLKNRKQLAVALNSGAIRLIDLVSDGSGGQKLDCYGSEKELLITGICPWIWNDYSFSVITDVGRPSRRCWKIVDLGHDAVAVGTDNGELPVVDLRAKKVVSSILVNKRQRAAVLVWDQNTHHLFTHSCPTDLSKGDVATLYAIELQRETSAASSASNSASASQSS